MIRTLSRFVFTYNDLSARRRDAENAEVRRERRGKKQEQLYTTEITEHTEKLKYKGINLQSE